MKDAQQFKKHTPANKKDVVAFETGQHNGPDIDDLRIDASEGVQSRWNYRIEQTVYEKLLRALSYTGFQDDVEKDVRRIITNLLKRAQITCRSGLKSSHVSNDESMSEDDAQVSGDGSREKRCRHNTRRNAVSETSDLWISLYFS